MSITINGTTGVSGVDGSSTTPAFQGTDTNTGLFYGTDIVGISTGGSERVRVDSSGNVGIGTTSPNGKFESYANSGYSVIANSSAGSVAINPSSNAILFGTTNVAAYATGNYDAATHVYKTSGTERMRIDSSGNVNIGQSSAFASSIRTTIKAADTSSQSLALVSAVTSGTGTLQYLVDGSNDVCGYIGINATANTTSYNTSSDYRLKENIVPMTGALDKVSQLKPVFWNWKHAPEIIGQGFIAHELAEVIPDAVSGDKDAVDAEGKPIYQGVDTSFLVATLTAAIQEMKAIIDEQSVTINDLKARVTALEASNV